MKQTNKIEKLLEDYYIGKYYDQDGHIEMGVEDKLKSSLLKIVLTALPEKYKYDDDTHRWISSSGTWVLESEAMRHNSFLDDVQKNLEELFNETNQ